MKRFLLLLLVVTMIVAGLAWATGYSLQTQAVPMPHGPGGIAWAGQVASTSLVSASNTAAAVAA